MFVSAVVDGLAGFLEARVGGDPATDRAEKHLMSEVVNRQPNQRYRSAIS
jgi:hypothetical protein